MGTSEKSNENDDGVKAAVQRKEAAWKEPEIRLQRIDVWKLTKKKRERLKGVYIRVKRRKIYQDMNGNKLFWKEVNKVNGGKVKSCSE